MSNLKNEIIDVLKYFRFFNYPPTVEEIYRFVKKPAEKRQFTGILKIMEKKGLVTRFSNSKSSIYTEFSINKLIKSFNNQVLNFYENSKLQISDSDSLNRYTTLQYIKRDKELNNWSNRQRISLDKLKAWKFRTYIKLLSFFPSIKLVGLSGSVAMLNADEGHDIDLFIITAKNRLFTGRFLALSLGQFLGIRRRFKIIAKEQAAELKGIPTARSRGLSNPKRVPAGMKTPTEYGIRNKDKICLNLFFDQKNLKIPKFKRSEFVAHEVLQMKPLIDRDGIYLRFIDANRWVFDIFPNAKSKVKSQKLKVQFKNKNFLLLSFIFDFLFLTFKFMIDKVESVLKKLQLFSINKHKTSELITDSQLWFHPEDFEKKIKARLPPRN